MINMEWYIEIHNYIYRFYVWELSSPISHLSYFQQTTVAQSEKQYWTQVYDMLV